MESTNGNVVDDQLSVTKSQHFFEWFVQMTAEDIK